MTYISDLSYRKNKANNKKGIFHTFGQKPMKGASAVKKSSVLEWLFDKQAFLTLGKLGGSEIQLPNLLK